MLANTRDSFFWPGLDSAIRLYWSQCCQCNEQVPSLPKEPPIETPTPESPFEQLHMDLCSISGFSYLVYVDVYSGWVEVANLNGTSFNTVREVLMMYFSTFGIPQELLSNQSTKPISLENGTSAEDCHPHTTGKATEEQKQASKPRNASS